MKKRYVTLAALAIASTLVSSLTPPAMALGGCGPNRHRNAFGICIFGGQNQNFCLRRTGHFATRMPNGTLRCL